MKKNHWEQINDVWAKEEKKAKSLGFETVQEYRQHLADENRKKTYLAKIAHYQKAIEEMQAWVDAH